MEARRGGGGTLIPNLNSGQEFWKSQLGLDGSRSGRVSHAKRLEQFVEDVVVLGRGAATKNAIGGVGGSAPVDVVREGADGKGSTVGLTKMPTIAHL